MSTSLNPSNLGKEDAARLLSHKAQQPISVETLKQILEAGAPQNDDGTLNIVHLAAWLIRERLLAD